MVMPSIIRYSSWTPNRSAALVVPLLVAIALLDIPTEAASDEDPHGAIAFSRQAGGDHAWGIAWSVDGEAAAGGAAIEECRSQGGGNCSQVGWFRNACGALAVGGGNGVGVGWGGSITVAEQDAVSECEFRNFGNESCQIVVSRCEKPEEKAEEFQVGEVFRDCPDCPDMVVIPAGSFMMGSDDGYRWEKPVHPVTIAALFAVGVYEVTRAEFGRFVSATGHASGNSCGHPNYPDRESDKSWRVPGFRQTDTHPVVCVSWDDARAYAAWLSRETGEAYRLLSESEWEYVARAGTTGRQPFGDGDDFYAWVHEQTNTGFEGDQYEHTAPVGSFLVNRFGLYDMLGNVNEWVEDCWNESYRGAPAAGGAWLSGDCAYHITRGGSYFTWSSDDLAFTYRSARDTGMRGVYTGFRVARTISP